MRYLIFSDVHANIQAFDAVLSAVEKERLDRWIFLGDIVGYGAQPNEAVERLKQIEPHATVRGNHDKVIAGIEEGRDFQELARMSALQSRRQMRPDNKKYLRDMPQGPILVGERIEISHGSPDDEDYYILSNLAASRILRRSQNWITFFGHTHIPMIYSTETDYFQLYPEDNDFCYPLSETNRYLINPGSVGQPRDLNPRASFAILDTGENTISIKRVSYDIRTAQEQIREGGLPHWHADRLAVGR